MYSDDDLDITTITVAITPEMRPNGPWFESDGAAWMDENCNPRVFGCDHRLVPLNWKAFAKGVPTSEMSLSYIPEGALSPNYGAPC